MNIKPKLIKINWYQAGAEVLLILIGLLFAITVDSWWDERVERADELAYLKALREEFISNRAELNTRIEREREIISYGKEIHSYIYGQSTQLTPKKLVQKIGAFYYLTEWSPSTGIYDEMVGSGRLLYFRNKSIRIKLARYTSILESIKPTIQIQYDSYNSIHGPFLNKHLNITDLGWTGEYQPDHTFSDNIEALRTKEFSNLVSSWMVNHYDMIHYYEIDLSDGDEIIDLLDMEISKHNSE